MEVIQRNGFVSCSTVQYPFIRFVPSMLSLFLAMTHPSSLIGQDAIPRITVEGSARTTLREPGPEGPLNNAVCSLGFSPDGKTLAVGMRDPNLVLLVDSATLAVRARLEGHIALVSRVVFSSDGQTLVSAGHDGTVRVWDISKNRQRLLIDQFQGNIRGLAISLYFPEECICHAARLSSLSAAA